MVGNILHHGNEKGRGEGWGLGLRVRVRVKVPRSITEATWKTVSTPSSAVLRTFTSQKSPMVTSAQA